MIYEYTLRARKPRAIARGRIIDRRALGDDAARIDPRNRPAIDQVNCARSQTPRDRRSRRDVRERCRHVVAAGAILDVSAS